MGVNWHGLLALGGMVGRSTRLGREGKVRLSGRGKREAKRGICKYRGWSGEKPGFGVGRAICPRARGLGSRVAPG